MHKLTPWPNSLSGKIPGTDFDWSCIDKYSRYHGYLSIDQKVAILRGQKYLPFEEAREYIHTLDLKNCRQWRKHIKDNPPNIPPAPHYTYRHSGWRGYGDWLGNNRIKAKVPFRKRWTRKWRSFINARRFVHTLGLKTWRDWQNYSNNRPHDIPANPGIIYKKQWHGMKDWLGA